MPPSSPDTRFQELLDKWLQGDFTRADEQEMRTLTEADEFRRSVWEGFWTKPGEDHAARLTALRARLQSRRPARVVRWQPVLAAVAAIGILLLAAIYFFPRITADQSAPIAKTSAEEQAPTVGAVETPETTPGASGIVRDAATKKSSRPAPASPRTAMPSTEAEQPAAVAAVEKSQPEVATAAPASIPAEALPASRYDSAGEMAKTADTRASDQLKARPAVKRRDDIALPAAPPPVPDSTLESAPAGGWDAFRGYLRREARLTAAARNNNVSGNVAVQFSLDENGRPRMFKILNSLGYGCDEEAIRLIQNYPWRRGRNTQLTIEVPFVR